MNGIDFHAIFFFIQHSISLIGVLIILGGVLYALIQFCFNLFPKHVKGGASKINFIRLNLGRILLLGLEFIVAADLIGTISAPDYYSVGILAIIVVIRTVLSFTLNREMSSISKEA